MSGYHGRTGPNFSQYINNLNTEAQPYNQDFLSADELNLDQELALFTNTDFTDLDNLGSLSESGLNFELVDSNKAFDHEIKYEDLLADATSAPLNTQPSTTIFITNGSSSISTGTSESVALEGIDCSPPLDQSTVSQESSYVAGSKRRASSSSHTSPQLPSDHQSRMAAEEDKRRRNTAASARFRVKKKQREQALERTVKEVKDRNTALEVKITQLEMENKWLKNLVTEKNGKQTREEIAEAYQQYRRESEERDTGKGGKYTKQPVAPW
jgi:hypothetical protein